MTPPREMPGGEPAEVRVLNVDDDEVARYTKSRTLKRAGWTVLEATTGQQAIEIAQREHPDLVLLDIRLPDVSGIEVCRRLKADAQTNTAMVLQTSALMVSSEDRIRGLEGGADYYLAQPFDPDELIATCRALLRLRHAEAAMRQTADLARQHAERLTAQNERLELLSRVTAELLSASELDTMLERLFNRIAQSLQLDAYLYYGLEGVDRNVQTALQGSAGGTPGDDAERLTLGRSISSTAIEAGRTMVFREAPPSNSTPVSMIRSMGFGSYVCTPLYSDRRLIGTLSYARQQGKPPISDDEVQFLRSLCGYVAVAIERIGSEQRVRLQTQKLQEADRRKDEFLAVLAHELRNPLAPILNAAHLLQVLYSDDTRLEKWRSTIERQARHMARMVDDLLDVARISQGKIVLRKELVSLSSAVRGATEVSAPLMESKHHRLTVNLPDEDLAIEADPTRLTQVLANLLSNAAKYTPDGGDIEIAAYRDGPDVAIHVKDNGVGLTSQMLPRLFELFSQADESLDRSAGGLGVGLALTRLLVELHGGHVEADSAGPGQGSTFTIRLPWTAQPSTGQAAGATQAAEAEGRSARVMIVEDNPDAAESMQALLEIAGHEVRVAHDGLTALNDAVRFRPALMLIDIGLPGQDGYQLAAQLRQHPATQQAYLVALSGYGQPEDLRQSAAAGFDEHLVKPFEPHLLLRLVSARTVAD